MGGQYLTHSMSSLRRERVLSLALPFRNEQDATEGHRSSLKQREWYCRIWSSKFIVPPLTRKRYAPDRCNKVWRSIEKSWNVGGL